jgi:hypothetical protein
MDKRLRDMASKGVNPRALRKAAKFLEALDSGTISIEPCLDGSLEFTWMDETVSVYFLNDGHTSVEFWDEDPADLNPSETI